MWVRGGENRPHCPPTGGKGPTNGGIPECEVRGTASHYPPLHPPNPLAYVLCFQRRWSHPIWAARVLLNMRLRYWVKCIYILEGGTLLECTSTITSRVQLRLFFKICDLGPFLYMTVFTIIMILWFCSALLSCYCMYICSNSLLYFSFSIPSLHFTEKSFTSKRMGLFHTTWTGKTVIAAAKRVASEQNYRKTSLCTSLRWRIPSAVSLSA